MKGGVPLKKDPVKREVPYSLNRITKREKPNPEVPDIIGRSFDGIQIEKQTFTQPQDEGDAQQHQNNEQTNDKMPQQGIHSQKVLLISTLKDVPENKSNHEMKSNKKQEFFKNKSNASIDYCIKLDRCNLLPKNPLLPLSMNTQSRLEFASSNHSKLFQLKKELYSSNNYEKKRDNNTENINQVISNNDYGFSVTLKSMCSQNKRYALQPPPPALDATATKNNSNNISLKQLLKGVLSNSSNIQQHDNGSLEQINQHIHPFRESKELSNKSGIILTQKAVANKVKHQFNSTFITSREKKTFSLTEQCSNAQLIQQKQSQDLAPTFVITNGHLNHLRSKSDLHTKDALHQLQDTLPSTEGNTAEQLSVKLPSLSLITPKLIPIKNSISHSSISNKVLFKGKAYLNQQKQEMSRINPSSLFNHTLIVSSVKQQTKKSMRDISVQSNDEDHDLQTSESFIAGESSHANLNLAQNNKEIQSYQNKQQISGGVTMFGNSIDFEKGFRLKIQRHLKMSNNNSASSDSIRFLKQRNNTQNIGHKFENSNDYSAAKNWLKMRDSSQQQQSQQQRQLNRIELLSSLPENGVASYHRKSFYLNEMDENDNDDYDDQDEKASYELETYVQEKRHID